MKWKTLSSEYLFKDLWFKVKKETCEKPDGTIITPYYVYEFPTWVTILPITKKGTVLLERQYRHALQWTGPEIPGGCVDDDDLSLESAAARELLEETGYAFEQYEYLGATSANPSTNNNLMHMFLATGGEKIQEQQLDRGEDIEVFEVSLQELKSMLKRNEFIQSMHVTCIVYGLAKLQELNW
jgi:ADP-ribose pyrophosphatase